MILFCSVLLWGHITQARFRIEWFVYSQTAAYVITALVASLIVIKKAQFRKLNVNWQFFLMIIKRSFPFALLVLLMTFYNRLDPVMLGKMLSGKPGNLGHEQVGIYANACRKHDRLSLLGTPDPDILQNDQAEGIG
jgi:O-antigen/teichoic acid export membrane protein